MMERQPTVAATLCARNDGSIIELIEQINATLQTHRDEENPDAFVIEQYEYRRSQYLGELAILMQPLGVEIQ